MRGIFLALSWNVLYLWVAKDIQMDRESKKLLYSPG